MGLRELEYIVAVAEERSISKAADRLFLAQSSLSQYLTRYESELNTKLFTRTSSGVKPTPAGEVYISNARQMLWQYHQMKSQLQDIDRPIEGRIDFGISSFRGGYLFPKVLHQYKQEAPAVDVVLHEYDSIQLQSRIAAGKLDMALIAVPPGEETEGRFIMRDEVVLVASREHPVMEYVHVGQGGPELPWVDLSEIAQFEFLLSNRSKILGSVAKQKFSELGIVPKCSNSNLTAPFAAAMARQGLGIAFTYRSCIEDMRNEIYLCIGKERVFVDLKLIYPPDGYRSRAIRKLEQTIGKCFAAEMM